MHIQVDWTWLTEFLHRHFSAIFRRVSSMVIQNLYITLILKHFTHMTQSIFIFLPSTATLTLFFTFTEGPDGGSDPD